MRHVRKLTLLLIVMLVFCCLSASASAVFRQPRSLKEIGDSAFEGVPVPENYDLLYGIEKIGSRAYAGTGVRMFWLPETLKYIAPDAFDKGTAFVCSPGTYAEQWCRDNGMDFDYIKPYLNADSTNILYGETATLTANYVYSKEPTEYFWEMRERERYWTPIPEVSGPVLRYTNTEGLGYMCFRVSAVVNGVVSTPSDTVTVNRYSDTLKFWPDKCKAVSGDTVYLEWGFLGKNQHYALDMWSLDPQLSEGGRWITLATFTGGWNKTVYGLDPNTEYKFMIRLLDSSGDTQLSSEPIAITTLEKKTSFEMREFWPNGSSVHMSWEPIHNAKYDVFMGASEDKLSLVIGDWADSSINLYGGFPVGQKRYVRVKAWIPGMGYEYWSPVLEVVAKDEGPFVEIDEYEVHGDVVNLQWSPMSGCVFDVYMRKNDGEESCVATGISKNYLDIGGFAPGDKAVFRVTARCGSWSTTSLALELTLPVLDPVVYRALLIGEVNFKGSMYAARNYGDVELVTEMLENVKTPSGTYYSVIRRQDLSRAGILAAIREAFGSADDNDVSLLFIATHGDVSYTGQYAGNLSTVEVPNKEHGELMIGDLAAELEKINGTKIVWLGSCGSGSTIYDPQHPEEQNISEVYGGEYDEDEWDGWPEYETNDGLVMGDTEVFDTGELRLPGFQVLAAARYRFVSYGKPGDTSNFFTEYLTDGVYGPNGSMPADLNNDGMLTQHELYTYIKTQEDDPETGVYQDVQAYPYESDFPLFMK